MEKPSHSVHAQISPRLLSLGSTGFTFKLNSYIVVKKVRPGRNCNLANERTIFDILERYPPSPFIFRSFYRTEQAIFLEYATYGDLASLLGEEQQRDELSQRVMGVLEELGLAHCDICLGNMLLYPAGHVKLADFDRTLKIGEDMLSGTEPFARLLGDEGDPDRGTYGKAGCRTEQFAIGLSWAPRPDGGPTQIRPGGEIGSLSALGVSDGGSNGDIRRSSTLRPSTSQRPIGYAVAGAVIGGLATASAINFSLFQRPAEESKPMWKETDEQRSRVRATYADKATMTKAVDEIRQLLGNDAVSVDSDDLDEHGYSEWSTSNTDVRPVAIARPSSTEQVSGIARICTKYKVPMVPYGAGSSVEGNFSSPHSGICLDFSEMNKIVAFHPEDMDVVVQAGVNWTNLNEEIKTTGLFLPLDPSPTALVGGMIATNCSGTNAMRYGTMKDYVVSLTVVLADGSIIKTRHRPRKTSAGYNLTGLFTGSEGTLGIITEATLKLAIIPETLSVAIATFSTVKEAADAAFKMMRRGVPLAALELMDDVQMKVINKSGGAGGRMWDEKPTLFLKFSGSKNTVKDSMQLAQEIVKSNGCQAFESANTEEKMQSLWSARKQALWANIAARPEGTQIWSTDVAVPLSRMAELIEISKERASKLGLYSSVLGHVGDGNFHQVVMYNPDVEEQRQAVSDCVDSMMVRALEMEGTVSGEHGIGLGKKHCLQKELGPATIGVMKALKETLDPHWLLNPGKVFDR
ncbi:hypothetical protein FZEAL_1085 [Fusarium zealandicum]|uniref:D-lactate dehydrogenase (cytochrome) n=1 Tax=Fusarium zealandicum TaxID=1053134 RepID=A0A8H4UTQ4_9HYPO|nr:hypothetical protein FZEAL_1085 [Fusarium zealandicum]